MSYEQNPAEVPTVKTVELGPEAKAKLAEALDLFFSARLMRNTEDMDTIAGDDLRMQNNEARLAELGFSYDGLRAEYGTKTDDELRDLIRSLKV